MSDEIASAVVQLSTKTIEAELQIMQQIFKLLHELAMAQRERERSKSNKNNLFDRLKETKLPLKSGAVKLLNLIENCRKNGVAMISSDQGFSKKDAALIAKKAKNNGISIAFVKSKGKDNIYVRLKESDVPIFKQICKELITEKLQTTPQELRNFKCEKWQIPFLNAEISGNDLSAQFGQAKNGEYFALYDAKDAKAINIARNEFIRKCKEIENGISIDRDEKGNFTIKELHSGHEIDFDGIPNVDDVTASLKNNFGFDENKAGIAAAKFAQEALKPHEKAKYFDNSAINKFSYVTKCELENESILSKPYDCYYVTPKSDKKSRVVFQNAEGNIAVLNPIRQTKAKIKSILTEQLGITDKKELNALVEKAEYIARANSKSRIIKGKRELLRNHKLEFSDSDFNSGEKRIDNVDININRMGMNKFKIRSTVVAPEKDAKGNEISVSRKQDLVLSFANKKTALQELKELFRKQGVPEYAANEIAKDVLAKAELQDAEKIISIEEKNANSVTLSDGVEIAIIPIAEKEQAIDEIQDKFDVPVDYASDLYDIFNEELETKQTSEKIMSKQDFVNLGLINDKGNIDRNHTLATCITDIENGDQSWSDETCILEKNGQFYQYSENGYSFKESFAEISKEEAFETINSDDFKLTEKGEEFINNPDVFDSIIKTDTANGHENHPEGNILVDTNINNDVEIDIDVEVDEDDFSMGGR